MRSGPILLMALTFLAARAAAPPDHIPPVVPHAPNPRGEKIFNEVCAPCHEHAGTRAPNSYLLKLMTPASI